MRGERAMAIFIGLIMVFSMVGFAATSILTDTGGQTLDIPSLLKGRIDKDSKIYVLRTGRVLIEHYYSGACQECPGINSMLESFSGKFPEYVVVAMEQVPENETLFQAIGSGGRITELDYNMTQESLLDTFCSISFKMPRECLLGDVFGEQETVPQSPADYY